MPCHPKGWSKNDIPSLHGKLAIVTGATGGIGYETALGLGESGATVILAGRNEAKGEDALEKLRALAPNATFIFEKVDLGSLTSIAQFCTRINERNEAVDILVNNAGVMGMPKRETTADGFEMQFGTNHLGHFALTAQLLPALKKSSACRVVNVSSIAHRMAKKLNFDDLQNEKKYDPMGVYQQSKLANLLFTHELQRRSDEGHWGIMALSSHPGVSQTDLIDNGVGSTFMGKMMAGVNRLVGQEVPKAALPSLFAATSDDVKPVGFYGPNGIYEMNGKVAPAYSAPLALDAEAAKKLWDVSVTLTGVAWV